MHYLKTSRQRGFAHLALLIAAAALIGFIVISSSAEFKDKLFGSLFPKPPSHAAEDLPGSVKFVDTAGNTITTTTSATVRVKYVLPSWGNIGTGSTAPRTSFSLVKEVYAQNVGIGSSSGGSPSPSPSPSFSPTPSPSPSPSTTSTPTPSVTLSVSPQAIDSNSSTSLTWVITGTASSCYTSNSGIPVITSGSFLGYLYNADVTAGSHSISITLSNTTSSAQTKTFAITCRKSGGDSSAIVSATVNVNPTTTATSTPTATPTTTPVTTTSIILAEDSAFTINVKTVGISVPNPIDYTFSNSTTGSKSLYVKFIASNGQTINAIPFPATIQLVAPVSSPTPSASPTISGYQRVFVTSTAYNGNLGGLSGADAKCQDRANVTNLGGTWKAWLSDSTTAASSRLASDIPYKLLNGTTIANNFADVTDGYIEGSIRVAENLAIFSAADVWTNTTTTGGIDSSNTNENCSNWTSADGLKKGKIGNTTIRNSEATWTSGGISGCGNQARLYCFEQTTVTSAPSPSPLSAPSPIGFTINTNSVVLKNEIKGSRTKVFDINFTQNANFEFITPADWVTNGVGFAPASGGRLTGGSISVVLFTGAATTPKNYSATITLRNTGNGQVITFPVNLTVIAPPTVTLLASPTTVNSGSGTNLTWTISGTATRCIIRNTGAATITSGSWGGNNGSWVTLSASGDLSAGSHSRLINFSNTSTVSKTKTFTISCSNSAGSTPASNVTVSVNPSH